MIPSEHDEQVSFVLWLSLMGMSYFHVPNSTYTKSWNQKRINKEMGVKPGVPDLFVVTPKGLIAIEMKRRKGGVVSKDQREWIDTLNNSGVPTRVCKGCEEAIMFVKEMVE
jgi:hypothetical protein